MTKFLRITLFGTLASLALMRLSPSAVAAESASTQPLAPRSRAVVKPEAMPKLVSPPLRQSAAARDADFIVAVVNSEPVTNHEVRARMARALRQMSEQGIKAPARDELRKAVLERLISERAQLQYAKESGLTVDDAALKQAELAIARQNDLPSVEALHRRIQQEGLVLKDFQEDVQDQVLLARLREREIEPKIHVSNAEVDAYVREQTGARAGEMELNLAMILVEVPEGSRAEEVAKRQARAQEVVRRARAGEDFAALAKQFSDAKNRGEDGGVLGLRPASQYPDLFTKATRRARIGEIVGPLQSEAGFHVLKVLERKQNTQLPEVKILRTHVHHILLRAGQNQSEQVALERLKDFKRRIESGQTTFEALAQQYSQDASASEGGDLGWAAPGQFVPEFEQAMNNLDPGQVSEPIKSRFGYHLIRVDDRREQVLKPEEQQKMARNILREQKAEKAFETWAQEIRGRAYVEYRDEPR